MTATSTGSNSVDLYTQYDQPLKHITTIGQLRTLVGAKLINELDQYMYQLLRSYGQLRTTLGSNSIVTVTQHLATKFNIEHSVAFAYLRLSFGPHVLSGLRNFKDPLTSF